MAKDLIVITGATRGLGRALTEGFIDLGYLVAGCGTKPELVAELTKQFPGRHRFSTVDVTNSIAVETWASETISALGAPQILINNAGVINRTSPLWELSADETAKVIQVNVIGTANVIGTFVPAMIKAGKGTIVNLSSGWGRSVDAGEAPYCASKWAIEGLTKALAEELPEGLAAVPLSPGIVDTDMLRICWSGEAKNFPSPQQWAKKAVPFILKLGPKDTGKSLSIE